MICGWRSNNSNPPRHRRHYLRMHTWMHTCVLSLSYKYKIDEDPSFFFVRFFSSLFLKIVHIVIFLNLILLSDRSSEGGLLLESLYATLTPTNTRQLICHLLTPKLSIWMSNLTSCIIFSRHTGSSPRWRRIVSHAAALAGASAAYLFTTLVLLPMRYIEMFWQVRAALQ